MRPAFREEELSVLGHYTHVIPVREGVPKLASPITTRENTLLMMNGKKPYWYPMVGMIGGDYRPLRPRMFPDLLVAHDAMDGEPPMDFASLPPVQTGWFDTKWRYVNTVGGPMIEPGSQKIDDMNDWQKLTWPNLDDYDVTMIDCGPALTTLTYTALTAADGVIVPCCADRFSLDALRATAATINTVAANSNKRLSVYGVLITMYNRRLTVARLMREQIERQAAALGWKVYDTSIRQCVAVTEATLTGNSVFDAGRNNAASDYAEIIDELLAQMDLR